MQRMLDIQPDNLAILVELGRIAAKRGDAGTLQSCGWQTRGALCRLGLPRFNSKSRRCRRQRLGRERARLRRR